MRRDLVKLGSETAKSGFENEQDVVDKFNNWESDEDAQDWLIAMNYKIKEIESVNATKIGGHHKADIQVRIIITLKKALGIENISIKLVTTSTGFNQIDKREIENYTAMWNIPKDVELLLKLFTGKIKPNKTDLKDSRRMLLSEMSLINQNKVVGFFTKNKILVLTDIIKGNDEFSANWFMVIWKIKGENPKWFLADINYALNFFGDGPVEISSRGSLRIGRVGMQRKGGDGGRPTAQQLQFKINPLQLFNIDKNL